MLTLGDFFHRVCQHELPQQFIHGRGQQQCSVSSAQFRRDVLAAARILATSFGSRQRILILGENSYPYILSYFACLLSANVPVLVDKDSSPSAVADCARRACCKAALISRDYAELEAVFAASTCTNGSTDSACNGSTASACNGSCALPFMFFDELLDRAAALCAAQAEEGQKGGLSPEFEEEGLSLALSEIGPDDCATVFFTSGSTGIPKLVPLSHGNILAVLEGQRRVRVFEGTTLLCLPLHHVFGLVAGLLYSMDCGLTVYICSSLRYLRADIAQQQPTVLYLVPQMYDMLARGMKGDYSAEAFRSVFGQNLKALVMGAALPSHLPVEALRAGVEFLPGYGLTETGSSICIALIRSEDEDMSVAGAPLFNADVRISADGEILLAGPTVFGGYEGGKEGEDCFDEAGYFRSGDLGYFDEAGMLHISGRLKNLIILPNGENVPAEYLESLLYRLPYVDECVVAEDNASICAFIYTKDRAAAEAAIDADLAAINRELKFSYNITRVVFRDEPFSKTSSGKIKRH